jgi:serine/threonine-protein kinase
MSDLKGITLNKQYYLQSFIGKGGMADVYKAWDNMKSTYMAVKILRRDLAVNAKFNKLFKEEAELLKTLGHPSIVRIYEYDREPNGNLVYIVMDWIEGSSLKEVIDNQKDPFTLAEVSQILKPLSSALYFAHQMGFIHCDIKPANILIRKDGEVFLSDFGVARAATDVKYGGTPWYMAYEQFTTGNVSPRTDVYSLAVTMYEMLSGGVLPYQGLPESQGSTLREKIKWEQDNLPLRPIQHYNRKIPSAVGTMLSAALSKRPQDRYLNTTKMFEAFELARVQGDRRGGSDRATRIFPPPDPTEKSPPHKKTPPPKRRGRKAPKIYCKSGDHQARTFTIPREGLRIGRGSQNALRILERSVSRWHVVIYITHEGTFLRDENSSLGTLVNGQQIVEPTLLRHGDIIEIGYHQVFEYREK